MPRTILNAPPVAPAVRYCGRCGEKLTQSNKANPPRCYNTQACESRARAKNPAPPTVHIKKHNYVAEGLTQSKLLSALTVHFAYAPAQIDELITRGNAVEYMHARYVLVYLLVEDLQFSYMEVEKYLGYERRTVSTAYRDVRADLQKYAVEIDAIRHRHELTKPVSA